jgi:hypothetical protein
MNTDSVFLEKNREDQNYAEMKTLLESVFSNNDDMSFLDIELEFIS